ncbi:collagen-like protein, partial [Olleya sp. 1-3]
TAIALPANVLTTLAIGTDGNSLDYTDELGVVNNVALPVGSSLTQVVTAGNAIATHESTSGTSTDILETVTTFVENTDGTVTYTNENNVATTVGIIGPQGPAGADGETGPAGPPGLNGANGTDGADGVDGESPTITLVKETIGIVFAAAHTQANGTNSFNINSSVTRTATGRYTVAFTTPHPNGANYDIALGVQEDDVNRDSRLASVVTGTQTANGFQVMIATGDNGTTADILVDEVWYFNTSATKEVITDVIVANDGGSGDTGSTNTATPTGTLTTSLVSDNFQDGNSNAPFDLQIRNNSGTTFTNGYQILLDNVPYSSIPNLNLGDHTLTINDNGDGTYDYLFSYTNSVAAWASVPNITGGLPVPAGTGSSCGCVTFYSN